MEKDAQKIVVTNNINSSPPLDKNLASMYKHYMCLLGIDFRPLIALPQNPGLDIK